MRTPVQSSAVAAAGCEGGVFEVEMPGGRIYACEATQEEFDAFMASESKGRALQSFRGRLTRVDPAPEQSEA